MTSSIRTCRMNRSRAFLLLAASTALTACAPDALLGPGRSQPGHLTITATGPVSLVSLGDSTVLRTSVLDRDGRPLDDVRLRWSVSSSGIVERDAEGVYRAVGNGLVTIVAEVDPGETGVRPDGYWAGRVADSVTIEVRQRPARLSLAPVDTSFATLGARRQLRAQVTDARGNPMVDDPPVLIWRSADPRVVVVDSAGVVSSLGEGTARITVRADALGGETTFTVSPRLPHTSCMEFAQRGKARRSCVTLDLILRDRVAGP